MGSAVREAFRREMQAAHACRARGDLREMFGQSTRIVAAMLFSRIWVPRGNTGGANVGATLPMAVPAERADWAAAHTDLIAGEILATSFDFGEPDDGVEIGDGVRVAITKA